MNASCSPQSTRRQFVAELAALPVARLAPAAPATPAAPTVARTASQAVSYNGCPDEVRARLSGPMPSLKTPFTRD